MKALFSIGFSMIILNTLFLIGCQPQTGKQTSNNSSASQGSEHQHGDHKHGEHKDDVKIKAGLDKLSAEDRKLAEAQKFCPITEDPLGSMGKPFKVMLKDQPVFLCCDGCQKKALADPEKTLAKVKELKAKAHN